MKSRSFNIRHIIYVTTILVSAVILSGYGGGTGHIDEYTAIPGGLYHTLALKDDGTVWAWGYNGFGQLGDGTNTDSNTPIQVSDLTDIIAIAGGNMHSLALKSDGTVWAWGNNKNGNSEMAPSSIEIHPFRLQDYRI